MCLKKFDFLLCIVVVSNWNVNKQKIEGEISMKMKETLYINIQNKSKLSFLRRDIVPVYIRGMFIFSHGDWLFMEKNMNINTIFEKYTLQIRNRLYMMENIHIIKSKIVFQII
jgi:hypothetical protein